MKIAIVDDHKLFAAGLSKLIKEQFVKAEIACYSDPKEFLNQKSLKTISILLLDLNMPELDGFKVLKRLQQISPNIKVIVISMHDEPAYIIPLKNEENLFGYLLKTDDQREIVNAITTVCENKKYFSNSISDLIKETDKESFEQVWFTTRELEILRLLNDGFSVIEIASELSIEKSTVETHKKNMVKKTGVNSTIKLLKYARDLKYL